MRMANTISVKESRTYEECATFNEVEGKVQEGQYSR
jgi:hypothetical protein